MAILSGGSKWVKLQKEGVGAKVTGQFVSFTTDVPSDYGPNDVLRLEVDGEVVSMSCKAALARVFRSNKVEPGTTLTITYKGEAVSKGGKKFHNFTVEDQDEDTDFDPGKMDDAAEKARNEEEELERRLAEARSKRKAA